MVGRGVRRVDRADSIDEDPHAVALEAAQDRARGAGRKAGCRNARHTGQHFADLALEIALQLVAAEHRSARQHVETFEAARAHDDHVVVEVVVVGGIPDRLLGSGLRGGRKGC